MAKSKGMYLAFKCWNGFTSLDDFVHLMRIWNKISVEAPIWVWFFYLEGIHRLVWLKREGNLARVAGMASTVQLGFQFWGWWEERGAEKMEGRLIFCIFWESWWWEIGDSWEEKQTRAFVSLEKIRVSAVLLTNLIRPIFKINILKIIIVYIYIYIYGHHIA